MGKPWENGGWPSGKRWQKTMENHHLLIGKLTRFRLGHVQVRYATVMTRGWLSAILSATFNWSWSVGLNGHNDGSLICMWSVSYDAASTSPTFVGGNWWYISPLNYWFLLCFHHQDQLTLVKLLGRWPRVTMVVLEMVAQHRKISQSFPAYLILKIQLSSTMIEWNNCITVWTMNQYEQSWTITTNHQNRHYALYSVKKNVTNHKMNP